MGAFLRAAGDRRRRVRTLTMWGHLSPVTSTDMPAAQDPIVCSLDQHDDFPLLISVPDPSHPTSTLQQKDLSKMQALSDLVTVD